MTGRTPPQQKRSQASERALLDAAARLLEEIPLSSLSLRKLAEEAGFTTGVVYRRFSGKDALLETLIGELEREVQEIMTEFAALEGEPEDLWKAFVDRVTKFWAARFGLLRAFLTQSLQDPAYRTRGEAMMQHASAVLTGQLGARTSADRRTIARAAQIVFATLDHELVVGLQPLGRTPPKKIARSLTELLWPALRPLIGEKS